MSTDQKATITVWTFEADPDKGCTAPIRTTCAEGPIDGGRHDNEGRRMFINSHFLSEGDAWSALADNADAHARGCVSSYRLAQISLKTATQRLADVAAFASEVREARKKAGA